MHHLTYLKAFVSNKCSKIMLQAVQHTLYGVLDDSLSLLNVTERTGLACFLGFQLFSTQNINTMYHVHIGSSTGTSITSTGPVDRADK
jgi:hypothetical protein